MLKRTHLIDVQEWKHQKTKGLNFEKEKRKVTIIICDMLSWPDTHSYKVSWRYNKGLNTELWRVQGYFFYNFQRCVTQKLRKGEQSFLCGTLCFDLYISIKYH